MTHHQIRILEDGTRIYSNGTRYQPVPPSERKYRVRKPDVPGAVLHNGRWYEPLDLLPEEERVMPDSQMRSSAPSASS